MSYVLTQCGILCANAQCGNFEDFSVIQILREIKFGQSRSSKTAVFAIFGAMKFVNLTNTSLQKVLELIKNQNLEPLNV